MTRKRITPGKIRLTEVAKLAGVSPITASRFFRNPEALSVGKRARVESAAKELGYVPNLAARALASQRTEVIGVLIPSLTNNVFADVLRGIYDALDGSRYSIQLANTRYSILQEERLLRLFLAQKPAGLIVTGINQTAESRTIMESVDCPIVQIMETGPAPIDMMIGFSHFDAAKAAISHLLERGYRRIGFLGARMDPRVQRRLDGYRSAMSEAELFDPQLIVTTAVPTSVTLGGTLFADLLAKAPEIDAVFCVNDDLALGALFECKRRHMAVPDQMAIVGFNDLEFMASSVPTLSSVRTNRYEMGRNAATMVLEALEGRRPAEPVVDLGFSIIERQSSARRS
ncbi:LacI family DNA-binding transcriptional regulator [Bradyrhizobium sp. ISRA443]|uniref:LacI family DNA-binding transcriptional regulator n=1 Tax=unclassified Bradyrhizobium TaxID=2631580 RepID=UPI0024795291|nr:MULTISPECIES: LacI family DNA-binding transcriptional regulator [unclassified Bradyrhizobium]WGR92497.1 LacI family DNA-binding transcriptional regulator [Bradyrhizobium sp. ISRA435]WGR96888.1 LacI family DNA-binding transcriptional regulator [Bradyrhizobium sp. ISRA436]WGS03775.1 LacI family DNA-binding transcriptional regulator [Bradyrhizobium sp. ISRA437]WGS10659.1 LacI family DNA-binding transcriptional regulator [Bradyrhizobium sp. ISRA443]